MGKTWWAWSQYWRVVVGVKEEKTRQNASNYIMI
jgi:peptidyl-tRNA hydrolase